MHTYRLQAVHCSNAVYRQCRRASHLMGGEGASLISQCHKSFIESFYSPATLGITQEGVQGKAGARAMGRLLQTKFNLRECFLQHECGMDPHVAMCWAQAVPSTWRWL